MLYKFKDLFGEWSSSENTCVVFVVGRYSVFNNVATELLKNNYLSQNIGESVTSDKLLYKDFGIDITGAETEVSGTNNVPISRFFEVVGVSSIMGRWYCLENMKTLSNNQKTKVMEYLKTPNKNGLLIIVSDDWKDYRELFKFRILQNSNKCHLIDLSFPTRLALEEIIRHKFLKNGFSLSDGALKIFISRIGIAYSEIDREINRVVGIAEMYSNYIHDSDMLKYMRGVEYFDIRDFVEQLALTSKTKQSIKKAFNMASSLIEEHGYDEFIKKVSKEVDKMIQYRIWIDSGYIPIGIKYFFKDVIRKLGLDEEKTNEYRFRMDARIASETTLKDWQCIKGMIDNVVVTYGKNESGTLDLKYDKRINELRYNRAIYDICARKQICENRLLNILEIDNAILKPIDEIDKIIYGGS